MIYVYLPVTFARPPFTARVLGYIPHSIDFCWFPHRFYAPTRYYAFTRPPYRVTYPVAHTFVGHTVVIFLSAAYAVYLPYQNIRRAVSLRRCLKGYTPLTYLPSLRYHTYVRYTPLHVTFYLIYHFTFPAFTLHVYSTRYVPRFRIYTLHTHACLLTLR